MNSTILKVGDRAISPQEILPLLGQYQLLKPLLRELIIDNAIAAIDCSPEEREAAQQRFDEQYQLTTPKARQAWCQQHQIALEQLNAIALRPLKIAKFKQAQWGDRLESYFLQCKPQLDQYRYSLIRLKDAGVAQELYFRLQLGEQSFAEIAATYSQGVEAKTGGLVGPVTLSQPHPTIARLLAMSHSQQLWPPTPIGEWVAIIRLEEKIPAQLNATIRQRLLDELFNAWLEEQLQHDLNPEMEIAA